MVRIRGQKQPALFGLQNTLGVNFHTQRPDHMDKKLGDVSSHIPRQYAKTFPRLFSLIFYVNIIS